VNGSLILLAIVAIIAAAIAVEAWLRSGKRRPLSRLAESETYQKPVPLGHEAIDLAAFDRAVAANTALANKTSSDGRNHSYLAVHAQPPLPMPDDATYAARYHKAFGKGEDRP
jgi:hypothetical protein